MTPWKFARLWMETAAKNTSARTGKSYAVVVYAVLGFVIGSTFYFFWRGYDNFRDEWLVWLGINVAGGVGSYCIAFITSCITAPYELYLQAISEVEPQLEQNPNSPSKAQLIDSLFEQWANFAEHHKEHQDNKTYVSQLLTWCRITVPVQLQTAFGKRYRDAYEQSVNEGFDRGGISGALIAAKSYLQALKVKLTS